MGYESHALAFYLSGASQQDGDLYVMINGSQSDLTFEIQEGGPDEWQLVFDTGLVSPEDFPEPTGRKWLHSLTYVIHSRSIAGTTRYRFDKGERP